MLNKIISKVFQPSSVWNTSNVTIRNRGPKWAGYRAPSYKLQRLNARPIYASCSYVVKLLFCIADCAIARVLFICAYSTFGHHPRPLGYLCAKFRLYRSIRCWASLWRKSRTQSLSQSLSHDSLTQLIWCAVNRSFRFGIFISASGNCLKLFQNYFTGLFQLMNRLISAHEHFPNRPLSLK